MATTTQPAPSSGFVSPTQLQAIRQQERQNLYRSEGSTSHPNPVQSNGAPAQTQSPSNHQRSSSFFSFAKHKQDGPKRQTSLLEKNGAREYKPQPTPPHSAPPAPTAPPPSLHPEIKSIVSLVASHAHKIYFSGPLVRKTELGPDGQKPSKEEEWTEVWAQLGGTTLSVWNTKEIRLASEQGREVPPSYINITDAFISVIGTITTKPTPTQPSRRYPDVFTINTAGANMILFSCPNPAALMSWAAALRLSAWEKSRLEELYTAHLIRISLDARDAPSSLVRGRLEGWGKIRVAGHTDWKRVYMVLLSPGHSSSSSEPPANGRPVSPSRHKGKNRVSALFSRSSSPPSPPRLSSDGNSPQAQLQFLSGPKGKDRKKPLLVVTNLTQAFGVYPERPELISRSTLIKVEGKLGEEDSFGGPQAIGVGAGPSGQSLKGREGWVLIMPEIPEPHHGHPPINGSAEMLRWIVGLHDAFGMYGRPQAWTWDPRDPASLMFAYPVGPEKDHLFLPLSATEGLNPRDEATSLVRGALTNIVMDRMRAGLHGPPGVNGPGPSPLQQSTTGPQSSPAPSIQGPESPAIPATGQSTMQNEQNSPSFQLPPLQFDSEGARTQTRLSHITELTERDSIRTTTGMRHESLFSAFGNGSPLPEASEGPPDQPPERNGEEYFTPVHTPIPSVAREDRPPTPPMKSAADSIGAPTSHPFLLSNPHSPSNKDFAPTEVEKPAPLESAALHLHHQEPSRPSPGILPGSPKEIGPISPPGHSAPHPLTASPMGSPRMGTPRTGSPKVGSVGSISPGPSRMASHHSDQSITTEPHHVAALNIQKTNSPTGFSSGSPTGIPGTHITMGWNRTASPSPQSSGSMYSMATPEGPTRASSYGFSSAVGQEPTTSTLPSSVATASQHQPGHLPASSPSSLTYLGRKPSGARAPSNFGSRYQSSAANNTFQAPAFAPPPPSPLGPIPAVSSSQSESSLGHESVDPPLSMATHESEADPNRLPPRLAQQHSLQSLKMQQQGFGTPPPSTLQDDMDPSTILSYLQISEPLGPMTGKTVTESSQFTAQQAQSPVDPYTSVTPTTSPTPQLTPPDPYKSSFAPNKRAVEREAKAREQAAAMHKPGRANGRPKQTPRKDAWGESSEEEEDEEDDSDDDDSPTDKKAPSSGGHSVRPIAANGEPSHIRPPRSLPQVPFSAEGEEFPSRRLPSDTYPESARRTYLGDENGPQIRSQAEMPLPGRERQTVWSQALESGRFGPSPSEAPTSSKPNYFVQLEPSEVMTKAFTPHGLLSAGLQDKQDRSAKRQEEMARESGASLINVPHKPPPPQIGLLGAVAAHERDRTREGGLGAALTEREREKRIAEEKQRKFDEQQRQQMEQFGGPMGSMYGGYNPMMGNPMMMGMNPMLTGMGMNPMMTGLNPMMTGSMFPGMMPGFGNQQAMLAAQQAAAQAYQQAMMSYAGSNAGGNTPDAANADGSQAAANPMMTSQFDPRMSMMGMPMMGMGMGMPMGGMSPMMTGGGMSTFDARYSPGNDAPLQPPTALGQNRPRSNSPSVRPSPGGQPRSRPASPKP